MMMYCMLVLGECTFIEDVIVGSVVSLEGVMMFDGLGLGSRILTWRRS